MNCLLQFRNKNHFEAYSHDLVLQIRKRAFMVFFMAVDFAIVYTTMYATNSVTIDPKSKTLITLRGVMVGVGVVGFFLSMKYNKRLRRHLGLLNLIFDVAVMIASATFYPIVGNISVEELDKFGVYMWAYSTSLCAVAIYFLIAHWWMKMLTATAQIGFFLYFIIRDQENPIPIVGVAWQGLALYLFAIYINEKFERIHFLEKRKIYENYEALMKIFDDISQGIVIIDQQYHKVYSNRTINAMFEKQAEENWQTEDLLSEFQVKSIFPVVDVVTGARMHESHENMMVYIHIHEIILI